MSGWPTPRDWVGDAPYPWPQPGWVEPGSTYTGCFTVIAAGLVRGPDGSAVLEIELADARGTTLGWLPADAPESEWLRAGLYVGARGLVAEGGWQLAIDELSPLKVSLDDLPLFLPHTAADMDALEDELDRLTASIREDRLRLLVLRLVGADGDVGRGFRLAPAASRNHHACLGGLFEHTISVARLCDMVAEHYGDSVDRDLLIAGALLHDIGKVREIGARAGFPYTDEGRLLGHILLGLRMISEAAADSGLDPERRLLLEHLVASHQGRYEWQSPREPLVLEGFILHYVDDLDAKVNHVLHVLETVDGGWTEYDRSLRRELLRHAPPPAGAFERTTAMPAAVQASEITMADHATPDTPTIPTVPQSKSRRSAPAGASGGKRKTARSKSAKKGTRRKKKTEAKRGGEGGSSSRATGSGGRRNISASGKARRASTPSDDLPIPAPGTPGFIDRDTLDLFEQTKNPTP